MDYFLETCHLHKGVQVHNMKREEAYSLTIAKGTYYQWTPHADLYFEKLDIAWELQVINLSKLFPAPRNLPVNDYFNQLDLHHESLNSQGPQSWEGQWAVLDDQIEIKRLLAHK